MADKMQKHIDSKLLSIELEMERAARYAAEKKLKQKENELQLLKRKLSKTETTAFAFSGTEIINSINHHLQTGILIENESGLVISINESFCQLFNIKTPVPALIGSDLYSNNQIDYTLFANPFYFQQRTNEILSNREQVRNDILELKNGVIIERDYIPLFQQDLYTGHIWYYTDATLKYTLEKKLEKQKNIYEKILSYLPADIAVLSPEYADLFLNPIAIKDPELRQWIIEWLIGKKGAANSISELKDTPLVNYQDLFEQVIHQKKGGFIEEKKTDTNGQSVHILRNLHPVLDEDGELEMIIGLHTDITERVRIEDELILANKKTEELAKAKDLFLANVSHEIRTPMNGILGVAGLLSKTNLNQKQKKMTGMIKDAASNLLVIVNDILNFEKISAGKIELETIQFSLNEKIALLTESFQYKAKEKNIGLSFHDLNEKALQVVGDPYRLSQIITNLLANAIKFTDEGSVEIKLQTITETPEEIWVRIEVKDSGIGIPEEKIDSLFQPYQQADSAISRKYGGTGLGLSIVKNLVNIMGGRIGVESNINSGSIFSIQLPFKRKEQSTLPVYAVADYHQLKGMRILLAEDIEMNQFIARSILEEKGVYITEAVDGRDAIEKVKSYSFDLILMDISMPYIDGIQATSIIRSMKDSPNCSIPIIALTANALEGDKQKYLNAGMNGYISKPFLEEEFLMVILQCLQKNDFCYSSDFDLSENASNEKLYSEAQLMGMGKYQQAFVDKMIGLFLQTMPEDIELLKNTTQNKDWKKVERTAHRIKSAIRSMGIQSAIQTIRYIEEAAQKNPPPEDIVQKVDWISQAMLLVMNQIKADYPHIIVSK